MIGGLAAFLTLNYVRGVESESAEQNQLVEVLVATGPVAKGTSADEAITTKLIAPAKRRRADLPAIEMDRNARTEPDAWDLARAGVTLRLATIGEFSARAAIPAWIPSSDSYP